jgi:Bor protein
MTRIHSLALTALIASAGCYHVTVVTGAPPAAQTIDKGWQNSFVLGLVPPTEISTKDACPRGVAKVETERSFLNGLVGAITYNIYTPLHATVTCASGPVVK